MAESDFWDLPEGKLFWEVSTPDEPSGKSVLLFIHAGITDHTLWNDQVAYFVDKGWTVLTLDLLGFGQSTVAEEWHGKLSEMKVEHWRNVGKLFDQIPFPVVVIGCSMGGKVALETALEYPDNVKGLVSIAGPLPGLDISANPQEEKLEEEEMALEHSKDAEGLAKFWVKYWGDGPLQKAGRADEHVREKMLAWAKPIATAKIEGTGSLSVAQLPLKPPAAARLKELDIPVAGVLGIYDETYCQETMRHLAKNVKHGVCKEFKAAHLPSLELPDEFNQWLEQWLQDNRL